MLRTRPRSWLLLAAGAAVGWAPSLLAQATSPPARRADDVQAIQATAAAFVKAFNAGDASAAAATFTEHALIETEDGERIEGRAAIEPWFTTGFADHPGSTLQLESQPLRFLGPDSALEEGTATVQIKGRDELPRVTRYTVIHARENGRWLQAYVRDETLERLTPRQRLQPLAFLLGDWVHEGPDNVVFASFHWDDDGGNYLIRTFTIQVDGKPVLKGTQRIGWDPLTRQIKSWVFDADGAASEALWSRDGESWVVRAAGALPDGRVATSTQIITPLGKDRIHWQSVNRAIGGEPQPDRADAVFVRKPPSLTK